MKKRSASQSAFFNPRVLIGFALCSIGVLLALVGWSKSVTDSLWNPISKTGMVRPAAAQPQAQQAVTGQQLCFGGPSYPVGIYPTHVVVGDFNADGKSDLATANFGDTLNPSNVSILIGNGDGTFQPAVNYTAGIRPGYVATGDFNKDGKLDLATSNYGYDFAQSNVSILLGNGDGTFQGAVNYPAGVNPISVLVGDFDKDGAMDLAVGDNNYPQGVSVLLGNGDGTFQSATHYQTANGPRAGIVADMNLDGNLDLAFAPYDASGGVGVYIFIGNGDGTFQPPISYMAGVGANSLKGADFSGDGLLDLAVANAASNNVSVLLGNGDGTFRSPVNYAIGITPAEIAVADLDGDGKQDLAATNIGSNTVSILLGNGDGTFQTALNYAAGSTPVGIVVGDFDINGETDMAVTNNISNTVTILLNTCTTVALSDTSLKFGVQLVGTRSAAQTATLTNTGATPLTISSITATGDFLQNNTCGSSLPAGASCTIKVAFRPSAKGVRIGGVTITDNATDSPQTIKLTGTGTIVELSPSALDFGNQIVGTTSDPQTATITNISSEDLHISEIGLGGANPGDFAETSTCGSNLVGGGSCTIDITFTPTVKGHRHAKLLITDDGGGSPQSVPLTGTGVLH